MRIDESESIVAYSEAGKRIKTVMSVMVPQLKFDEKNQKEESIIKDALIDIGKLIGDVQRTYIDMQANLKQSAITIKSGQEKYQSYLEQDSSVAYWTKHHTKIETDALHSVLEKSKHLHDRCIKT